MTMHHRHRRHRRRARRPGRQPTPDGRRARARRPRARPGRRALAHRALGLPAPAHAQLDDPPARLPLRAAPTRTATCPATELVDLLAATPQSSALRSTRESPSSGRSRRRRRRGVPGRHRQRHVCARGQRGRRHRRRTAAAVPARRPAVDPTSRMLTTPTYRNPGQLPAGGGPRGGRLRHPECRSPTSWPAPAARSCWPSGGTPRLPRRYRGMDVCWWLEATGRSAAPSTSCPTRSAARREPSLQLVGRNDPASRGPTWTWPPCTAAACGWPAG